MQSCDDMVQATIPFFDGENYDTWRFKMEVFLECHDLLDVVTKDMLRKEGGNMSSSNPSEDLEVENTDDSIEVSEVRVDVVERSGNFHDPEKEEKATELRAVLRKKDRKALYFIHQAVSNSVFKTIEGAKSAAEAWHAIKAQYKLKPPYLEPPEQGSVLRERVPYPLPFGAKDRSKYLRYCAEMNHAAENGDWKMAEDLISKFPDILRTQINHWDETALHIAVVGNQKFFVQKLVENMEEDDLLMQSKAPHTALAYAAVVGNTEIAKMLVDKNPRALLIPNEESRIPLHFAARSGHREMVLYLYRETDLKALPRGQLTALFFFVINSGVYDIALKMLRADNSLALEGCFETTPLQLLARKPSAISSESQLGLFKRLIRSCCGGRIFHKAWMRTWARRLVEELWMTVIQSEYYLMPPLKSEHMKLLFDAAEVGNVEFLVIFFRSYPGLISEYEGRFVYLFAAAARNRQESVFNLIYEFGYFKNLLASNTEHGTGNTMLHLVASLPPRLQQLEVVSGPALQMQRELLWFEAVKNITPPYLVEKKNREGELAQEIFIYQHEELRVEGMKWMNKTASSCMLVATLVATVAFASAFTVPGGNDQNIGIPIFKTKRTGIPISKTKGWFNIFVVSDAVALCTSVLSGVFFLSILTSRYAEKDFRRSLPLKLTVGLLVLAISISAMLLAFSASLFLIYSTEHSWIPIFTISLASGTAFLYGLLHWRLLFDTIRATFWSSILFRPWRRRIYPRRFRFPLSWVSWMTCF